jgi:hypothetical protein
MKCYFIETINHVPYTGEFLNGTWWFASADYDDSFKCESVPTCMMEVDRDEFVAAFPWEA